jgi:hypothetical protein
MELVPLAVALTVTVLVRLLYSPAAAATPAAGEVVEVAAATRVGQQGAKHLLAKNKARCWWSRSRFYFSIRCRRNSSVPHPSLARICTGV